MKKTKYTAWSPCNIYPTATIGNGCSIGMFSEIGDHVVIGYNTRVGAHSFIPCGVVIGDDVFIGPHVCFTNDRYPPSDRSQWEATVVEDGAAIGAACTILCGVTVGANSTIGAGSVVTRSVPANEVWAGNPARRLRVKGDNWNDKHST